MLLKVHDLELLGSSTSLLLTPHCAIVEKTKIDKKSPRRNLHPSSIIVKLILKSLLCVGPAKMPRYTKVDTDSYVDKGRYRQLCRQR